MINDRIAYLIETLGITNNRFSESINVNPTVVHNIIKGRRSKPSYDLLEKILDKYEEVNSEWLLRGTGRIWKSKTNVLRSKPTGKTLETKIIALLDIVKKKNPSVHEAYELHELVELLIDENDAQQKKMIKLHERQDEIIKTLVKMKQTF